MRGFLRRKTMILTVAVLVIVAISVSAAQGKYQFALVSRVLAGVCAPFNSLFMKSAVWTKGKASAVGDLMTTYRDNQKLTAEVDSLRAANLQAAEIWAENERLRQLLDYKRQQPAFQLMTASVVGRESGQVAGSILIDRGRRHGVEKDMPVITAKGLVGTVAQAYDSSAQVQLLLHPRSAVGGVVQRAASRAIGVVSGNTGDHFSPQLQNLARDADVVEGDVIVTSGFGGLYPKGIAIGVVREVRNAEGGLLKYALLAPTVDFNRLEEVMLITNARLLRPEAEPGKPVEAPAGKAAP